jgi:adenylate kinase
MKPITCIFFGKSGSGKGTQADLLIKYLKEHDPKNKIIYIETGAGLREMVKGDSYTSKLTYDVVSKGGLMPPSIPIYIWSDMLMKGVQTGKEHLIFDGVARRVDEAPVLDQALQFYGRGKVEVVFLEVPHDEVTKRLLKRGRHDDHHEKIAERLKWFESDVMPSVNYFKKSPNVKYLHINGHQTIEEVHRDILKELGI